MTQGNEIRDPIEAIGALAEPTRRRLYELVVVADEPVGRDDAVAALGISRELAAFHLGWSMPGCSRPPTGAATGGPVPVPGDRPSSTAVPIPQSS